MAITELLMETLTAGAKRLAPFIPDLVAQGKTLDEIQEIAKNLVGGARRSDIAALIRADKEIESSIPYLSSVRNDRRPDPARLPQSISDTLRTYSFNVKLTGTSAETGELVSEYVTISTSELLTAGELKEAAIGMVEELAESGPGYRELFGAENLSATLGRGTIKR